MRHATKIKIDSTIYDRIKTVRMSEVDRQVALGAMRDGEMIADGIVWVVKKIERLASHLLVKPSLKH